MCNLRPDSQIPYQRKSVCEIEEIDRVRELLKTTATKRNERKMDKTFKERKEEEFQ